MSKVACACGKSFYLKFFNVHIKACPSARERACQAEEGARRLVEREAVVEPVLKRPRIDLVRHSMYLLL
jgi:hypothetical protein